MKRWWMMLLIALMLGGGGGVGYWRWRDWQDHSEDGPILAAARRYGVEPALVKAVVWRESRFNPHRVGRAGEIGLMQIRDEAASEWAVSEHIINSFEPAHLFDPATNTLAGTWYLQKLLSRYPRADNPLPYALADYNAGRSNAVKWMRGAAATNSAAFIEQIGFPGTRNYVRQVMKRRDHYRPLFPPKAGG
jgi:soluble lytic murein transglycosylase